MPGSIRTRLLGLVTATVVPFLALIGGGFWSQWQTFQEDANRQALSEARLLAAQIDDHFGNLENLLTGLSRAVSTNPADTAFNDALLRKVKSELPSVINNILLFAPDGTNIGLSAVPRGARPNGSARPFIRQALSGQPVTIGEVTRAQLSGAWIVAVARPVEDRHGHVAGVLTIGTQLEKLQQILRTGGLPAGSVIRIIDQAGIVVAQIPDGSNWIGRNVGTRNGAWQYLAAMDTSEPLVWPDGVERITGTSVALLVPWRVSVGLPADIALATVASRLEWGAAVSVATLVAAFSIAWMLSGHIVRPLQRLSQDALLIATGELSHRTVVRTADEVGALAQSFNRMADAIERRRDENKRSLAQLQQANDTLAAVINASPVAIVFSNPDRRIALWNRAAEQIFGYSAAETVGHVVKTVPLDGAANSRAMFERALNGETIRDVQVIRRRKDGVMIDTRLSAAPLRDADGSVRGVAWVHEDITDRKKAEEQLKHLAHHDPLTGLPNRVSLKEALAVRLDDGHAPTSIAMFDLDGFKDVNDTLGHTTGDQLLVEVARRLGEAAGARGQVYRLGGDEFIAVMPDCGDPLAVAEVVGAMLQRLAEPFTISDQVLHLTGSAGIAMAPHDAASVDELIANADLALYRAKADGRGQYRLFVPTLRAKAQARRALDAELRRAFAENELELFFQPQIRLADGILAGAEALLRWRHPTHGVLAPGLFIETLANSAIAPEVGLWIIRSACQRMAAWRAAGLPLGRVAVNLFPVQLNDPTLADQVREVLLATGLPADALELEITENVALDYEHAVGTLHQLRWQGVHLAFDDFGTGFASLSYLTRFPLSRLKIDRSFVSKISGGAKDAAIIRSIIAMAHSLGLEVVAEGVETEAQAAFLANERCDEAQGFLYAPPLAADQFEIHLRDRLPGQAPDDEPMAACARGTA